MPQGTAEAAPLVMVTGASSGIGKALAIAFARDGHPLLLMSRHIEPIAGLPEDTVYRQADVADYRAIEAAVDAAIGIHGPVECLVNNAGMADARAFDEVDEPSYTRELDTNLKGVFNCTKAVLAGMRARQSGTIINISSISDRKTSPVALAYSASKRCAPSASHCARRRRKTASGSSTSRRVTFGRTSTRACISASRNTAPGSATPIS
jgi:NADP-dependent 3-hydroxy acid dehydrogenase YdfG